MLDRHARAFAAIGLSAVFLVASGIAFAIVQPMSHAPLAYDTASSVLHFERIVEGHRLVESLGTTPKPLLTLVDGIAHALLGWSGVSVVTIAAWGLAVALGAWLAGRVAGPTAAAALAATLIASPSMLLETAWGLGLVWALAGWFAAGLAVTASRPRWAVAGTLLAIASLARLETLLVVGLALVVIVARRLGPRPIRGSLPKGVAWVGLGLLALPVMLLHDWLLTGDPLYWAAVSARYSAGHIGQLSSVVATGTDIVKVALRMPLMSLAALAGFAWLIRRRRVPVLVGLTALGPGVAAFLLFLAARRLFVDPRYLVPIELVLRFGGAVALGWLVAPATLARLGGSVRRASWPGLNASGVVVAVVVALLAAPRIGPLDGDTIDQIARARAFTRSADASLAVLRTEVARHPGIDAWPGDAPLPDLGRAALLVVPTPVRPRLAVDLDLPLSRIASIDPAGLIPEGDSPAPGQILLHSGGDLPAERFAPFEISVPAAVDGRRLVPLLADASSATWVLRAEPGGG